MRRLVFTVFLAFGTSVACAQTANTYENAATLYQQVASGQRSLQSMTPKEQQQVMLIARLIANSCSGPSEKCRAVCEAANDLESAARNLASCASAHDYSDSCDGQFGQVQNAHYDLQDAVDDADGDCD